MLNSKGIDVLQVSVVDNGSTDATCTLINSQFPEVAIIVNPDNVGYGAGNNIGARQATGDYIAIVNPDLVPKPDALGQLVAYLEQNPDVGIVAPRTLDSEGHVTLIARSRYSLGQVWGLYWNIGYHIPELVYGRFVKINRDAVQPTDAAWLQGSCLVMRRDLYEQIGGFDERFFLYCEDADLCERVWDAGYRVVYLPAAEAMHIGGATTRNVPLIRVRSYHLSPLLYFQKREKPLAVIALKLIFTGELLAKLLFRRVRNLVQSDSLRAAQARAEWQVLNEVWGWTGE